MGNPARDHGPESLDYLLIRPVPFSLPQHVVDAGGPITNGSKPVLAWVSWPTGDHVMTSEMEATAISWNKRAAKVRIPLKYGLTAEAWVWASACRSYDPAARRLAMRPDRR